MEPREEAAHLAKNLSAVTLQIQQLQAHKAALEAAIASRVAEGDLVDENGKVFARVKPPGLKFDRKLLPLDMLSEEDLSQISEISATKLKKHDPDLYESCRVSSGKPRIEFTDDRIDGDEDHE